MKQFGVLVQWQAVRSCLVALHSLDSNAQLRHVGIDG